LELLFGEHHHHHLKTHNENQRSQKSAIRNATKQRSASKLTDSSQTADNQENSNF
jgi:hypothetical protein